MIGTGRFSGRNALRYSPQFQPSTAEFHHLAEELSPFQERELNVPITEHESIQQLSFNKSATYGLPTLRQTFPQLRLPKCTCHPLPEGTVKSVVRLIAAMFILLGSSLSFAGKHPVPLDKNTDSAKCIECHEDKSKGKVVHSAIAMGCTSCHEVRVNKEVTRIKLITTTQVAL